MNNIQNTLLFPVRDEEARKQFLFACLVTLAGFVIPLLPFLLLTGYCARIMRQVIEERKDPSMPDWQGSDWSAMLLDGLRLYGAQMVLMLPILFVMGFGFLVMISGSMTVSFATYENADGLASVGALLLFAGIALIALFSALSLPLAVIVSAAGPHVVAKGSFAAAFDFKGWWEIFRKGMGQFILAYALSMALSLFFILVIQLAMMTIVLMCIVPLLMIPYSAYLTLLMNTLYAQAYRAGHGVQETA
jgi:hypothetical protein